MVSIAKITERSFFDLCLMIKAWYARFSCPLTMLGKKKTIPLPGGAEHLKLAMPTNTGSVLPTGSE